MRAIFYWNVKHTTAYSISVFRCKVKCKTHATTLNSCSFSSFAFYLIGFSPCVYISISMPEWNAEWIHTKKGEMQWWSIQGNITSFHLDIFIRYAILPLFRSTPQSFCSFIRSFGFSLLHTWLKNIIDILIKFVHHKNNEWNTYTLAHSLIDGCKKK